MAKVTYKDCSRCGLEKPADQFSPDKRAQTGLQPSCRACQSAAKKRARDANIEAFRERERQYWLANRERVLANNNRSRLRNIESIKARKKAYYERVKDTPEFKEKIRARQDAAKDAKREYDRQYRARNPQKVLDRANAWRKRNPDKRAAIIHNYSARRRAQTKGGITTAELAAWKKASKKVCYWCGARCAKGFHVDHYTPLSKGGTHEIDNLVIACAPCNLKKNAKDPLDFAKEVGRLL